MAYDIFISYRRIGGYETAKHLFDLLSRDGYSVSFDIDTLRNGDFDVELLKRVEECTDFILILNQGAFDRTIDPNFDPQKDWLRQELAHALKLDKNVIPIMLNGFTEFPDNLPTDIARVQKKNGPKYDQYYFDGFYNKLVDVFLETPKPVKTTVQATTPKSIAGTLIIKTDLDCAVYNYGEKIGEAKAGEYTSFTLPLGDNELMYVGLECNEDCYEETITINENHQKSVKVALLDIYNARLLSLPDNNFEYFYESGKCGFRLKSTENIIIPAKYDEVGRSFREGLAKVGIGPYNDRKYGYIDKTGKEVVPCKYDAVGNFHEGLAWVRIGSYNEGKYGYIDKTGKVVIPLKYNEADDFSEGLARVHIGAYSEYSWYRVKKYGFIDKTGNVITPFKYNFAGYFREGLACINIGGGIPKTIDSSTGGFQKYYKEKVIGGKWGFIDKTGKEIVLPKYNYADFFVEGLAPVELNGKWGYIDKTGKETIPFKYDMAWDFSNGLAPVELNNKWGWIDKTGKEIIPLKYRCPQDSLWFTNSNPKIKVELNGEWFYIDKNGNRVEE